MTNSRQPHSRQSGAPLQLVAATILLALFTAPRPSRAAQTPAASSTSVSAPRDISGDWQGTLEFPGSGGRPASSYRLVLRIAKSADGTWTALNYSIDQGPQPMQTSGVTLQGDTFRFTIPSLHGHYEGQLSRDSTTITGQWIQSTSLPLTFVRATKETAWEIPKPPPPRKPMAADADPSFAVATIKPSDPTTASSQTKIIRVYGGHYVTRNTSLADLIEVAYGVHPRQIKGPAWVTEDKFDLIGVPDGEGEPSGKQWLTMVQKLLAQRFMLSFHREQKELPVYFLSVGKAGLKNMTASQTTSPFPSGLEFLPSADGLSLPARNTTMPQLAQMLQQVVLDRPVIDKTNLAGRFDFGCTFTPDDSQFGGHPPRLPAPTSTSSSSPGLFEAMEQQLGLKLTPETAPVDVLVIDQVQKPSPN